MLSIRQILANNLKYLMSASASLDTQKKLEAKSGVAQSTIGRTLREAADTGIETVESLAKAFKLDAQDLLDSGLIDRLKGQDSNIGAGQGLYHPVPLISWVAAGMLDESIDLLATNDAEEWLQCPYAHSASSFCLQINGLSMSPDYRDKEIILVDPMVEARHNSDVVVRTPDPDKKTTFKRLQITEDGVFLLAINPDFPGRIIEMPEGTKICGVVTGSWMRRR
ncbi:LexA family protein [Pseudomonas chlororaphis]|uniref:LexA family protein n=1 Tax=Pseudomonas chlororaphis TaxID=587753 RepID=UPI00352A3E0C